MGHIFYLMGKSSSGKDTLCKRLMQEYKFCTIVLYTTRPRREGEKEGREYHFVSEDEMRRLEAEGRIVELRAYHTVYGIWYYFTVDDGQIDTGKGDYLLLGTLESYQRLRDYYGRERFVPLYIEVEAGVRLLRAVERERRQREPKYAELCRRYLADEEDFSEEKLCACGITKRYQNLDLEDCLAEMREDIDRIQREA